MADLVNLRRARKHRERVRAEAVAAENRVVHGMTRAERQKLAAEREKAAHDLDARRLDRPDGA